MIIAVGSQNPVKINAALLAFQTIWPEQEWQAIGTDVSSGVSDQPMSDEESIAGATTRAHAALASSDAEYGVGLEGGIQKIGNHHFDCGWIVVVNKEHITGIGSTVKVIVPPRMMKLIENGMELGEACDEVFKGTNTKQAEGHFGLMTNNAITRTRGYKDGVIMALVRFIQPQLFID